MTHTPRLLLAASLFLLVPAAFAAASDACDGTTKGASAAPIVKPELFAYDAKADLGVQVAGTTTSGAAVVTDLTFAPRPDRPAERVAAYIVAPATPATSLAAVLWVHWLGEPATTNRTQFLDEATALAGRGVVSVLVDTMWAKPRWYRDRVLEEDLANYVGQTVALRRALDLLLAQPGADPARVAVVGHDYGAMHAALLAGVDPRPKAYVMIAATASMLDWAFFYGKAPVSRDTYLAQHDAISLCDHLATAKAPAFLFQFAEQDRFVALAKAQALFAAAGGRKQMSVYSGAGHEMTAPPAIRVDRTAWLVRELGLAAAPTLAAATVPSANLAFTLPRMSGLIEGIAYRAATRSYYFGDVHLRRVWVRHPDGTVAPFSAADDRLLGIFRLEVDEAGGALWVAMTALPQMAGYTDAMKGRAGVAELDLATGQVRRVALVPPDGQAHVIGDLVRAADGTIYATDSAAPILWRLKPGAAALDPFIRSELFPSLQGITPAGDAGGFLLTDYRRGVVYVNVGTTMARVLAAPASPHLRGCDTILRVADGVFLAIQNGTNPQRVLRLAVSAGPTAVTAVRTLTEGPGLVDATLGTVAGDRFVFVADGGWGRFEPGAAASAPRDVPVWQLAWAEVP